MVLGDSGGTKKSQKCFSKSHGRCGLMASLGRFFEFEGILEGFQRIPGMIQVLQGVSKSFRVSERVSGEVQEVYWLFYGASGSSREFERVPHGIPGEFKGNSRAFQKVPGSLK